MSVCATISKPFLVQRHVPTYDASSSTSTSLLHRVAAGDQRAVAETIDRFGGLVWHLARKLLHSRADQEDAVQEVFVELWKAAGKFDPSVASERTFVAMIARRRLIDRGRREKRRISSTVNSPEFAAAASDGSPISLEPGLPPERSEEVARAAAALQELSPAQQQAIRMSIYDGLSHQEIADRLSVPLGTVKTNLRRGLIRIRELMGVGSGTDGVAGQRPAGGAV